MAARPGLRDRLANPAREGLRRRIPLGVSDHPSAPMPEARVAAYVAEASSAMRAGDFHAWISRPEPFPSGMESYADPALQIACLHAALDRLADVCRRLAGPTPSRLPRIVQITSQWMAGSLRPASAPNAPGAADEQEAYLLWLLISRLVTRNLPYTSEDVVHLLDRSAVIVTVLPSRALDVLPLRELLTGLVRWAHQHGLDADAREAVARLRAAIISWPQRTGIQVLLADLLDEGGPEGVLGDRDEWGLLVRETLRRMEPAARTAWRPVLEQAATATGARPTGPWRKRAAEQIAALGQDRFWDVVITWLDYFVTPPRGDRSEASTGLPALSGIFDRNTTILRGLIWCCADRDDSRIARAVGDVTEASFKKLPGIGPRSVKLGNAGIYALGAMPGMHGVEQLARLRQRVGYAQARKAIDAALDEAATRLGLAREDLDDLATPTFDLVDSRRRFDFPPFAAELVVGGPTGTEVRWLGADGVPAVPSRPRSSGATPRSGRH